MKWPKTVAICVLIIGATVIALTKNSNMAIAILLIQSVTASWLPAKKKNESE